MIQKRLRIFAGLLALVILCIPILTSHIASTHGSIKVSNSGNIENITWVDFNVTYEALEKAMNIDIETFGNPGHISWIDSLSYLAAKYGGNFNMYRASDMDEFVEKLNSGQTLSEITKNMKYFSYYQKAYSAVLSGMLGEFAENGEEKYGLKAFSPIAEGYWYNDYDDFGAGRSYGYARKHFGHDLMISTGAPIIAVESGIVEAVGWNQYGGWRIGIRSYDGERYYYYAHLRKDHPYNDRIYEGMPVTAGDVIGYSGQTGYSIKENVNNIDTPHLHYGMQLIFDESEKDSPNQIWIDMYAITKLLSKHKSSVYQPEGSDEYYRAGFFKEKNYFVENQIREEAEKLHKYYMLKENIITSDQNQSDQNISMQTGSDDLSLLNDSSSQEDAIELPIIMYHALVKDEKYQNTYFIDPGIFESDIKYLHENGYNTVVVQDLIDYTEKGTPLPENPVMLTFDDGYYNNYIYAYPILEEYGMKAVISPVGKFTDDYSEIDDTNEYYAYMSWEDLKTVRESGVFEIQNHTYNLHITNGSKSGILTENQGNQEQYIKDVRYDLSLFQIRASEMIGITPTALAYPYGSYDAASEELIKELGFKSSFTCREGMNYITNDPESLYKLNRFLRSPDRSIAEILKGGS